MKKSNKAFAIALIVAIVSVISIATASAHKEAGKTCKHSHHLKDLKGNDVHTDNSPSKLAAFEMGTKCTTHDGYAGTCKTTMRRTSQWNHTWAVCKRNSSSISNRFSTWNLGRNRMHIQTPRYENPARFQTPRSEFSESTPVQTRRSEFSESTPRFRSYSLR